MLAKGRPAGISRTDVGDLFDRNKEAGEIDRALGALEDTGGLVRRSTPTAGPTATLWIARIA
jgi:hypothetical protein